MERKFDGRHIFALFVANVAAWGCNNIYIPCLPNVAADFGISDSTAKLTILLGTAGAILSRIVIGPLSDYFGRKKLLIAFISICMMGLMGCYFSTSINWFLFFRCFQGIGSGAVLVEVISILSDTQSGNKRARLLGLVELSWPIGWGLSPLIGAWISAHYSWRMNFVLLVSVLLSVVMFIACSMPETLKKEKDLQIKNFSLHKLLRGYATLSKHKLFLSYAMIPGFVLGGYMIFAINGPFIYRDSFAYTPQDFALLQAFPLIVYFLTILIYRVIIEKFGFANAYKVGVALYGIYTSITLMFLLNVIPSTPNAVISIICSQCLANAFLVPAGAACALQYAQNSLGTAASFIAIIRNVVVTALMYISGLFSVTLFGVFALIFSTTVVVLYLTTIRRKKYQEYEAYASSSRRVGDDNTRSSSTKNILVPQNEQEPESKSA